MHQVHSVDAPSRLSSLTNALGALVPHEYAASGAFSIRKCELQIGFSNYGDEFSHLYASQGFLTDPSIQLLQMSRGSIVSSEDSPDLAVPREVVSLKLDFGIKTCLSVGIRGVMGWCTYFAFSNFDRRQLPKLRSMMQIIAPHFHLAYLRAVMPQEPTVRIQPLTPREEEIMRWVAEGKTNWEISMILGVSLNTIKFHLKNIFEKLGGVENRWTAVANWQRSAGSMLLPSKPSESASPSGT